MKVMVISFLLLFLISNVSGLNFSIESPSEAGNEFNVKIISDENEKYDVKIFVGNSTSKTISEIFSDGWKSSYYYVKSAFPEKKEFRIKVNDFEGETKVCARLRKVNSTSFSESCNNIKINNEKVEGSENVEEEKIEDDKEKIITENKNSEIEEKLKEEEKVENISNKIESDFIDGKIILNEVKKDNEIFISKREKTRTWVVYSFTIFCVIIIILLALRKL